MLKRRKLIIFRRSHFFGLADKETLRNLSPYLEDKGTFQAIFQPTGTIIISQYYYFANYLKLTRNHEHSRYISIYNMKATHVITYMYIHIQLCSQTYF